MIKMTIEQIDKFKHYLICEEKSKATIEKYIHDVTAFYKWLSGRELTKDAVLEYKAEIVEKYAPASVNSILASIMALTHHRQKALYIK